MRSRSLRHHARATAVVLGVAFLVAACAAGDQRTAATGGAATISPAAMSAATTAPTRIPPAALAVGIRTLVLRDESRTTDAGIGNPTKGRSLTTTVWYPAAELGGQAAPPATAGGPYPLVVFSHGYHSRPGDFAPLLERWAAAGYVVAAPLFPLTNGDADPIVAADVRNQPGDVSFVISELLARSAGTSDPFAGLIDPLAIVAAGHSLGGFTTAGLFDRCCVEARLAGAIIMSGNEFRPDGEPFAAPPKPVLFIHGDGDRLVPYVAGFRLYEEAPDPKAFLTLLDQGHVEPFMGEASGPAADVVRDATAAFLGYVTGRDRVAAHDALRATGTRAGISTLDDRLP
jgi:fermentation-respiration switch protein FrsA (DUF1100 family)